MDVFQIDLLTYLDTLEFPNTTHVTQQEFDLITMRDPKMIYIIVDAKDNRVYEGDSLIIYGASSNGYFMNISHDISEYIIWQNIRHNHQDRLIEICRFKDPQLAIDTLAHFNRTSSHHNMSLKLYKILLSYIDEKILINELLIGIMSIIGYREDPRLQELIGQLISQGVMGSRNSVRALPPFILEHLDRFTHHSNNHLYKLYLDLYNIIVMFGHFTDDRFKTDKPNLSKVIDQIYNVIQNQ